jgi:hypothetical protein
MGSLPLYFEQNVGQAPREFAYIARTSAHTILISSEHVEILSAAENLRLTFEGANATAPMTGVEPLRTKVNYLVGPDRRKWRTGLATWGQVRAEHVYPGIGLVYHGAGMQLEYDFALTPGADPSTIRLRVEGSGRVRLNSNGDAVLTASSTDVTMRAPKLYQDIAGTRRQVEGGYHVEGDNLLSFAVGKYDRTQPLIIDPVLVWAGTIGGASNGNGTTLAADSQGNSYVGGGGAVEIPAGATEYTLGAALPGSFVAEVDAQGALVWLSYIDIGPGSLAVDGKGAIWVAGNLAVYKLALPAI